MAIQFNSPDELQLGNSSITPRDVYVRPAVDPNKGSGMENLSRALSSLSGTVEDLDKKAAEEEAKNNDYYVAKAATGLEMGEIPDPNALTNIYSPKHAANNAKYHEDVMAGQGRQYVTTRIASIPPDVATDPAAFSRWANTIRSEALAAVDKAGPFSRSYISGVESELSQLGSQVTQVYNSKAVEVSTQTLKDGLGDSKRGYYTAGGTAPKPEFANALIASAKRLNMDPAEYAAIISNKTKGTFDPWVKGEPNEFGIPTGLIQMSDQQRVQYGYKENGTPDELFSAVEAYLWGNNYKAGMSVEDVYSIINTGAPGNSDLTDTAQGGDEETVRQKTDDQLPKEHYQNGLKFLGLTAPGSRKPEAGQQPPSGRFTVVSAADGRTRPENFKAVLPEVQDKVITLANLFGENIKITPKGGKQADGRKKTSQHHHGKAVDLNIQSYDDVKKAKLVADAIVSGATGLGSYSVGDGVGTIHVDYREEKGNDPSGLAIWHRMAGAGGKSVDKGLETAPAWFQDGVREGLARRASGEAPYQVADASGEVVKGSSPNPTDNAVQPVEGNLRWDVLLYQNTLFQNDEAIRLTNVGSVGKEAVKDYATDDIVATAIDKRDETWLQAMPAEWVDEEVRAKFDEARTKISAAQKADIAASNAEQERIIKQTKADEGRKINERLLTNKEFTADELREINKLPGGDDIVSEYFTRKEKYAKGQMDRKGQNDEFNRVRQLMRKAVNEGKSPLDVDYSGIIDPTLNGKILDFADKIEAAGGVVTDPFFQTRWSSDRRDLYQIIEVLGKNEPNANMPYIDDAFNTYLEEAVFEFTERTGRTPSTRKDLNDIYRTARENVTTEVAPVGPMPKGFIDLPGEGLPADKSFFKPGNRLTMDNNTLDQDPLNGTSEGVSDEVKKKAEELYQ